MTILPGNVKSPEILFKHALQEGYAAATNFLNLRPKPNSDTVRMFIKHDDLISHNHMWSSSTNTIGNGAALRRILEDWENAMQSGEEVDLSSGSIEFICQYILTREQEPANTRRVGGNTPYKERKEKMYNRITIQDIFNKDNTLLHDFEKNQVQRLIDYLVVVEIPHGEGFDRDQHQNEYKAFYSQYDQRRGKSFTNTFANTKLLEWYDNIK